MTTLFYRRPRLTALVILLIAVAGLTGYFVLPRLEDPVINNRYGIVKTRFPGATPRRVESLVTERIEEAFRELEEIKTFESTSSTGISIIQIELRDEVTQVDAAWARVRDKLDEVRPRLPDGAGPPRFEEIDARAFAMIVGLSWTGREPLNASILRRRARDLKTVLETVPGTEKVELFGEPAEEVLVEIDPSRMAALGLTVEDVSRQLAGSDARIAAGQVRSRTNDLLLEVANSFETLEQIRNTPIRQGNGEDVVRLGDVAVVKKTARQPAEEIAVIDGQPGIAMAVYVLPNRRIDQWAKAAHQALDEYRGRLPSGLALQVVFDQSRYTTDRLNGLMANLGLGFAAVFLVVLLLMGLRSAVLVCVALPLSALMVFAGMWMFSIAIHQMSVMGLIIALGLLIDNAIVMVDDVSRELRAGKQPLDAVRDAVRKLAIPLLASTLTTILAFMPIALMIGPSGEFVDALAMSVIFALASSLFLALTVVPALTGFLRCNERLPLRARRLPGGFRGERWRLWYRGSLKAALNRPVLAVVVSLALPLVGFYCATRLPEQFFPPSERDQFHIEIELPAQASSAQTQAATRTAERLLRRCPSVRNVHWFVGRSAPIFYYNIIGTRQFAPHYAQGMVQLDSVEQVQPLVRQFQRELSRELPDARVLVRQLQQGPPFPAPIECRIYGPDPDELRRLGQAARLELSLVPHVVGSRAALNEDTAKLGLQIDENETRLGGLNNAGIARQLHAALQGFVGGSLLEESEQLPVRVRFADRRLGRLRSIELSATAAGPDRSAGFIPLASVADVTLLPEAAAICRRNGRRVNTIQGYTTAGVLAADVFAAYRDRLQDLRANLPPGYSVEFGGESSHRNEAIQNLLRSVGVLVALMVATLVMSFWSFRMAGIIGAVGMLSVGLGTLTLGLFGYPFGFMAILGTMGLVGVSINDSIVVLAAIRNHPAARNGDLRAIQNVVFGETRHVLATTLTTVAGFLPLLLDGGNFWPPLAVAIAGGVVGATFLALYFVPAAYLLLAGRPKTAAQKSAARAADSTLPHVHQRSSSQTMTAATGPSL